MKKIVKQKLPRNVKFFLKKVYYFFPKKVFFYLRLGLHFFKDTFDVWTGKRDRRTPPAWRNCSGSGNFHEIGNEFFTYFIKIGKLQPYERILDIGCGIGRMAVPLTAYLNDNGSYEGVDVVPDCIKWCQRKITRKFPNFQFCLIDVFNYGYNPLGKKLTTHFVFPFEDESFDFIFLTSVFTHMLPEDVKRYLSEIHRLLKPAGRCLITYFLINSESLSGMEQKLSEVDFKFSLDEYFTMDEDTHERGIAFNETFVRDLYKKNHLKIKEPSYYGAWSGRTNGRSFQDIIFATKSEEEI